MEVLLRTTIEPLGRLGDIVKVKAGYARNYLLPRGMAVEVNKASMQQIEQERKRARLQEAARVQDLRGLAESLKTTSVTIEGRANDEGHLFGSVNAAQIARALTAKGFDVEERQVRLENPIKAIGVFDVAIHLHAEVETSTKVWVVQTKPQ